jgi:peptidoglycan/xylan/chitin deacetylase (PgdA/CDA1 family)/glycosyltransferase involved in cell wall biosynthesis
MRPFPDLAADDPQGEHEARGRAFRLEQADGVRRCGLQIDNKMRPLTTDLEGQHSKMTNGRHGNSVRNAGDGSTESLAHARPVLSAVVFAYRNEATILQAVSSLVEQDFDEPFEVVVATSGGDRTGELVRQNFPSVRVIESPVRLMPGGARNLGMKLARGDIIAFLEADCIARPDWIRNRVAAHRDGHEAVVGTVAVANPEHAAARATVFLCFENRLEGSPRGRAGLPRSYHLSFSRELLNRAGPFDEALRTEEDTLMAQRLRELGVSAWLEPSVCIEHVGPTRLSFFLKEQAARGRRQARTDVLIRPPGSSRVRWESRTGVLTLLVAARTVYHGLVRGRFLSGHLKRYATAHPHEVVTTLPWVLLGLIANMLGWAREQYAYAGTGAFTELEIAGLADAPLRRRTAATGEKTLTLTFNDGPSEFTTDVLRVLSKYGVPATFFVLGERAASMPEVVRSLVDAGHGLAIHGWNHTAFTELDPDVLAKDLGRAEALLRELSGTECRDIRPPMGLYDGELISRLDGLGLVTWLWTAEAREGADDATADRIAGKILLSIAPGGIVLLHDGGGNRSETVRALPRIIEGARARGFRFVTLDEVRATQAAL